MACTNACTEVCSTGDVVGVEFLLRREGIKVRSNLEDTDCWRGIDVDCMCLALTKRLGIWPVRRGRRAYGVIGR